MNSENQVTFSSQKQRHQSRPSQELTFDWLSDPDKWDKDQFSNDMVTFIEQTQGVNAYPILFSSACCHIKLSFMLNALGNWP